MFRRIGEKNNQAPMTLDEIWSDYYLRIRAALFINISVTTYVFIESIIVRRLGLYVSDFHVGLGLAIGFYSSLFIFWFLNEYNYKKRKFTPRVHFYSIGVSIYLVNLAAITDLIHLTGGASSLYPFLYVFLAMVGSFIAPQRFVLPLAILGVLLHGAILWLEVAKILPCYPSGIFSLATELDKEVGSIVVFSLFTVITLIGMFFGQWLFRIFESQREELILSRSNLEEKVNERTKDLTVAMEKLSITYKSLGLEKRRQENFFAHVTHQFRTPIHVINSFVSNFFDNIYGAITPRQTEALNHLSLCSQNLLNLVNNLLDMSNIRAGKLNVRQQVGNLSVRMEKIAKFLQPFSLAKKAPIVISIEPDVVRDFFTDWVKLEAILTNLLHNAIKFSRQGPVRLHISVDPGSERMVFRVEDSGPGVPREAIERIFEAFEQHQPDTEIRGSGLGLFICRAFAKQMGGEIICKTKEGAGAIFDLTLPYLKEKPLGESESNRGASE